MNSNEHELDLASMYPERTINIWSYEADSIDVAIRKLRSMFSQFPRTQTITDEELASYTEGWIASQTATYEAIQKAQQNFDNFINDPNSATGKIWRNHIEKEVSLWEGDQKTYYSDTTANQTRAFWANLHQRVRNFPLAAVFRFKAARKEDKEREQKLYGFMPIDMNIQGISQQIYLYLAQVIIDNRLQGHH